MAESEKVIKGIEQCLNGEGRRDCGKCPYLEEDCMASLQQDALELLKKDEVKPEIEKAIYDIDSWHYV